MTAHIRERRRFPTRWMDRPAEVATVTEVGGGGEPPSRLRCTSSTGKSVLPGVDCVKVTGGATGDGG
jgi:hypothetical protein